MALSQIHDDIRAITKSGVGVAVGFDFLEAFIKRRFEAAANLKLLTNMPFPAYKGIGVSCVINTKNMAITADPGASNFKVTVEAVVTLHVYGDPTAILGAHTIAYQNGRVSLASGATTQPTVTFVVIDTGNYSWNPAKPPANRDQLLVKIGLVDAAGKPDTARYQRYEDATFLLNDRTFFDVFSQAIPFPAILSDILAFKLQPPIQVSFTQSHALIFSENVQLPSLPGCPMGGSAVNQLAWEEAINPATGIAAIHVSQDDSVKDMLSADITAMKNAVAAQPKGAFVAVADAIVLYYPQKKLFDYSFGVLKPSLTESASGNFNCINWYYGLTEALKGVTLSFQQVSKTEGRFTVDTPFEVFGQAGASVKIGCVDYQFLGVTCHGDVDPFTFEVMGGYSRPTNEIYLTTMLTRAHPSLAWTTGLGFPFDQIATWLLNTAIGSIVSGMIGRKLNIFRMRLAQLNALKREQLSVYGSESDSKSDSFAYAINVGPGD